MRRAASLPDGPPSPLAAALFAVGGVASAALYAADVSPAISDFAFVAVGVGTVLALLVGPQWHRVEQRRPWRLLSAAAAAFLIGALVRPWAASQTGAAVLAGDMFTVPGYVFMIFGVAGVLRARRGVERHAVIDGLIICVGAALLSVLLLAAPAASIEGRPAVVSALAGIYPLFDVILVLLLANLAFTTAIRRPSYLFLVGAMALLLLGDLSYAVIGASGHLTGSRLLDLPFLVGFTMSGAAALHPSVVELGRVTPLPVQAWSLPRLLLIGPALAAPFVLTAVLPDASLTDRMVLALGGAAMVALLLVRAVSAVQAYAAARRRSEYQAAHDPLTGLPNRRALSAHIDRLLTALPPVDAAVWVFFLDLDGFKLVNDSWGHETGDRLIIEVARRLRRVLPVAATIARVGGDEFVVVQVGTQHDAIALVAQIMDCFASPLPVEAGEVVITAAVGIAGTPTGGSDTASAEALMRDADIAMYQAKSEGPGKWTLFDSSMHDRVRERVETENALRHALSRDQLRLAYQPIVEIVDGRLVGAEALIRWDHPERGPVPPTAFIPIAEDTGLISVIGGWVLHEALRQLARWRADGTVDGDFWVSVNVSPRQLRDPGLPGSLAEALLHHGVPAAAVVLEITESVMIDASAVTEQVLFDLRSLGVRIVVDDFGTGYSALGYLRRHPVTGVKIDRAFVGGLGASAEDEEIVRAVVAMSTALGLTVVAEGVETQTQQTVLAALGVTLGQGHMWGRPVEPLTFAKDRSGLFALQEAAQADTGGSNSQ